MSKKKRLVGAFFRSLVYPQLVVDSMATARYDERMKGRSQATKEMEKEYTPIRRFYAWVGFAAIIAAAVYGICWVAWANAFINAALK